MKASQALHQETISVDYAHLDYYLVLYAPIEGIDDHGSIDEYYTYQIGYVYTLIPPFFPTPCMLLSTIHELPATPDLPLLGLKT